MGNKLSYPAEEDLSGKVAIVTGGNAGIGYETAKALAMLGAHTFIACRSQERAEAAIDRMKAELNPEASKQKELEKGKKEEGGETGGEGQAEGEGAAEAQTGSEGQQTGGEEAIKLEYLPLDLSSFQSTIDCVRVFKERNLPLHILINNAALCAVPYRLTDDGYESQLQVNHLSHMLLTLELLPLLLDTAALSGDGRILFISSSLHYMAAGFDLERLNREEQDYSRMGGYNNTKLYNVMTGFALQRRLQDRSITVSSVHPGYVQTEISRGFEDSKFIFFLQKISLKAFGRNPVTGAATSLNCAVNPDLKSQQHLYYESCRPKQPSAQSRNEVFQEQLWRKSFEFFKDYLSPETMEKYGPKPESEVATGNQEETTADEEGEVATGNQEETTAGDEEGEVATGNHEEMTAGGEENEVAIGNQKEKTAGAGREEGDVATAVTEQS